MNTITRISACITVCSALLMPLACTEEATPVKYKLPEVEFPMSSTSLSAEVGQTVTFRANVVSGDKVSVAWYVNDVQESSAQIFDYVFEEPGFYSVRFEARNGAGSVGETYSVTVSDCLKVSLSVGDSTVIERIQKDVLRVAAIVDLGSDIEHSWYVNGVKECDQAFFNTFVLSDSQGYNVRYTATNPAGTYNQEFKVKILERPLHIEFNITDEVIKINQGSSCDFVATVVDGASGVIHSWFVNEVETADDATFSFIATMGGSYNIRYHAVNAKGEVFDRSWKIVVDVPGDCFDDFEGISSLKNIWGNGNAPGIQLADNPAKDDVNSSEKCMSDEVSGSGGTSGFFTLKFANLASSFDLASYKKLRFKVHFNGNKYYPRIDISGKKYTPVTGPVFNGGWEILEYDLPVTLGSGTSITIRPLLKQDGSNISGKDPVSNNRKMYFDDFELVK